MVGWALSAAFAGEPTAEEQQLIWELNRARHDPAAWAAERGLDGVVGGDGEPTDLRDVAPQPPLAPHALLADSARGHADEMAEHDYFGHVSEVDGRWPNERVRDCGYPLPDAIGAADGWTWPIDDGANNVESIAGGFPDALAALEGLILDAGVDPPAHRDHLLGVGAFWALQREIGVGTATASSSTWVTYHAVHTALRATDENFLTGVVYDDRDADGRYDPGEGLEGVTVTVGDVTVHTAAAGGWALAVPDGEHAVSCDGPGFFGAASGTVTVAGASRALDFVSDFDGIVLDFAPVSGGTTSPPAACAATPRATPGALLLAISIAALRCSSRRRRE